MKRAWHPRYLLVLAFAHGASDFFSGMVPLLVFTIVHERGMSAAVQGALGFLWYLTSSVVQPAFGAYSDRRGRWWFLPASVALTALSIGIAGATTTIPLLAGLIIVGGVGSAIMHPEAGKYAAMLSGERRSAGIAAFQIGGSIGYAAGPVAIATLIAAHGTAGSLRTLWFGVAAVAVLVIGMYRLHGVAVVAHAQNASTAGADGPLDRIGVGMLVGATALRYLVGAAFTTYLPNLIVARGGTIGSAGFIVTLYLAAGVLGLYGGGWLGDRVGPYRIAVWSMVATVPALLAFFALGGTASVVMLLLANVLLNLQSAPSVAIVQNMLPRSLGMALGLMNGVAFGVGSGLVTAVGFAVTRFGAAPALREVAFLPLACGLVYAIVSFRTPRRTAVPA